MELIDRKALMQDMGSAEGCGISCDDCAEPNCLTRSVIKRQPTVVADPVRHGKWSYTVVCDCNLSDVKCSNCDHTFTTTADIAAEICEFKYCPNCGAKMDGGAENE